MDEAWDLRPNDERTENTLRTFVIFCEDEHHEPLYFRSFERYFNDLKINAIENQKSKKLNINAAIKFCTEKGLIAFENGAYIKPEGIAENLWCVYDRDLEFENWNDVPVDLHVNFTTSILTAEQSGIRVAWSNDVFELWILLHFEMISHEEILHRTYVYDRLTHIFKYEVPRNPELDAVTQHDKFNYKSNMKRRERFITQVLPLLHGRTDEAIHRAEMLASQFSQNVPPHERNPCTMVYLLVQEVLKKGE